MKEAAHSFPDTAKLVNVDSRFSRTRRPTVKGKKYEGSVKKGKKTTIRDTTNSSLDFVALDSADRIVSIYLNCSKSIFL